MFDALACPVCGGGLAMAGNAMRCSEGHAFDVARQGYVHLVPGGAPQVAGDDAAMMAARAAFLAAGHFAPITDAVAAAVGPGATTVVDAGAGTGHHLAAVLDAGPARTGLALDASKYAARRAARAHPRAGAAVCDLWGPWPLRSGVADAVLNVFAPRHGTEIARVLAPGGRLVTVTPTREHLVELREPLGLLAVDERKEERVAAALEPHLARTASAALAYPMDLDRRAAAALAAMGPSARHVDAEELERRVAELSATVRVTAAVSVATYVKG